MKFGIGKRGILLALTLCLTAFGVGCGASTRNANQSYFTPPSSSQQAVSSANTSADTSAETASARSSSGASQDSAVRYKIVSSGGKQTIDTPYDADREDGWKSISYDPNAWYNHAPSKGSNGPKNTSSKAASSGRAVQSQANAKDTILVDIRVECLNARKANNPIAEKISAENGEIRPRGSISLKKDSSVYDLLLAAQVDPIEASQSMLGVYVKSIRSLAEKACGSTSGWMYFVNGKQGTASADKCVLSDGDYVEWRYTVHEGDLP